MFFIIWGWRRRVLTLGTAGPYTCPTCHWVGTFWVRQAQRQLRLYFVPVMKWSRGRFFTMCRNCGTAVPIDREAVERVVSTVQPIGVPDPFGPAPALPADQAMPPDATTWRGPPDGGRPSR